MFEIMLFALMAQAAPAVAEPAEVSDGDKIVCKSQKFVGTNIRERICKKKSEWDDGKTSAGRVMEGREMHRFVKGQNGTGGPVAAGQGGGFGN